MELQSKYLEDRIESRSSRLWRIVDLAVAAATIAAAGVASLWLLWEQDIYWQVRAGKELISTLSFPTVDTWSYTSQGKPWMNVQWLSTILLSFTYDLGGVDGLIVLRALLVCCLLSFAYLIIRNGCSGRLRIFASLALLPLIYSAASYRLQVRSDTFVFILFGALVFAWTSEYAIRIKQTMTVALVLVAANMHVGTAPFLAIAGVVFNFASLGGLRGKLTTALLVFAAFFCTPYHVKILPLLWSHLLYGHYNPVPNPDHRPLNLERLDITRFGWFMISWIVLSALGWLGVVFSKRKRVPLPEVFENRLWTAPLFLVFTLMCINRDRSIPYQILFLIPLVVGVIVRAAKSIEQWKSSLLRALVPSGVLAIVWLAIVPTQLLYFPARWGFGLEARLFPASAVEFVRRTRPNPNILHMEGDGNYLLGNLASYPVFIDTREMMYRDLQKTYFEMVRAPEVMADAMNRYGIRTVLMPNAFVTAPWSKSGVFHERREAFFPKRKWALVFYDTYYTVLVSRTPEHEEIIRNNEFHLLVPHRRPNSYFAAENRTPESNGLFKKEVDRCFANDRKNVDCAIALASLERRTGGAEGVKKAIYLLQAALKIRPNDSSALLELNLAYSEQRPHKTLPNADSWD